jgi:hypothetical protein
MVSFQDLPSHLALHISSLLPQQDILSITATSRGLLLECSAALRMLSVRQPREWEMEEAGMLKPREVKGRLPRPPAVSSALLEQASEETGATLISYRQERLLALLSRPSTNLKELTATGARAMSGAITSVASRALDGLVCLRLMEPDCVPREVMGEDELDKLASALLQGALPRLKTLDL